ncbi:hypothetical protein AAIH06_35860, partial [Pseudomonas aeruginosa]
PADSIHRCQYLMASAGVMADDLVGKLLLGDLHMLIHASRNHRLYGRKITHVCLIQNGKIVPVFEYNIEKGEHIYLKSNCCLRARPGTLHLNLLPAFNQRG